MVKRLGQWNWHSDARRKPWKSSDFSCQCSYSHVNRRKNLKLKMVKHANEKTVQKLQLDVKTSKAWGNKFRLMVKLTYLNTHDKDQVIEKVKARKQYSTSFFLRNRKNRQMEEKENSSSNFVFNGSISIFIPKRKKRK